MQWNDFLKRFLQRLIRAKWIFASVINYKNMFGLFPNSASMRLTRYKYYGTHLFAESFIFALWANCYFFPPQAFFLLLFLYLSIEWSDTGPKETSRCSFASYRIQIHSPNFSFGNFLLVRTGRHDTMKTPTQKWDGPLILEASEKFSLHV